MKLSVEMPLLAKELIEQAVRPRTYIVRFLYAATLFTIAVAIFYGDAWWDGAMTGNLGQGRYMFHQLVLLQFWAIYLLVPALVCGTITVEKEQNSLSLLLLTTLSPASILFQKLFGRLVPVLSFLLLSFPLMAVAYSFGGVAESHLWSGILLLVATCIQVGAISLLCSSYFAATAGALVGSYIFTVLAAVTPFSGRLWFEASMGSVDGPSRAVPGLALVFGSAIFAFGLARAVLVTRAFVPPRNVLMQVFQYLDQLANDANEITGGIVLIRDKNLLPDESPIAWRETAKRPLGTARYLFRVLTVLELPILVTCQLINTGSQSSSDVVSVLLYIVWAISIVLIIVQAASLISSERSRQTLNVLLAIPFTGRRIILEKYHGVRRLLIVLLVPFATIFWFQDWWRALTGWNYLILSALTVLIYLPLTAWFSLWMGLRIRSQLRAILSTLAIVALWIAAPIALASGLQAVMASGAAQTVSYVVSLSPAILIPSVETRQQYGWDLHDAAYGLNFVVHGFWLWWFRRQCLTHADRLLGRIPEEPTKHVDPPPAQ